MKMDIQHLGKLLFDELQQTIAVPEAAGLRPVAARDQMEIFIAPGEAHADAPGARPDGVDMELAHGVFAGGQSELRARERIVRIQRGFHGGYFTRNP